MEPTRIGGAMVAALLAIGLWTAPTRAVEIGPETDLCSAMNALQPGEELVLRPGDYRTACVLRHGGTPGSPIVIRSAEPLQPARLVHPGGESNVLEIRASDVTVRGLHFGPTGSGIDGVRVISGRRVTVEECEFTQIGGIAVVANHTSIRGLTVRRNVITESTATGMYFGCHDGLGCMLSGLVIEGNFIRGVMATAPQIGYGMQVKLNSSAVVRDNVVLDTKGPGIMVYGAQDLSTTSLVERNFVSGSRTSSGIVLGGGPVVVRNNVSGWNLEGGIGLENYGRRGLLRGIVVAHNSVYANVLGGLVVPEQGPLEATFLNNAVHARAGTLPWPTSRLGLRLSGNVDCSWLPCFANADALDFSPFLGSVLVGRGLASPDPAVPADDFFGNRRSAPATIGAVDRASGPIRMGVKP